MAIIYAQLNTKPSIKFKKKKLIIIIFKFYADFNYFFLDNISDII